MASVILQVIKKATTFHRPFFKRYVKKNRASPYLFFFQKNFYLGKLQNNANAEVESYPILVASVWWMRHGYTRWPVVHKFGIGRGFAIVGRRVDCGIRYRRCSGWHISGCQLEWFATRRWSRVGFRILSNIGKVLGNTKIIIWFFEESIFVSNT